MADKASGELCSDPIAASLFFDSLLLCLACQDSKGGSKLTLLSGFINAAEQYFGDIFELIDITPAIRELAGLELNHGILVGPHETAAVRRIARVDRVGVVGVVTVRHHRRQVELSRPRDPTVKAKEHAQAAREKLPKCAVERGGQLPAGDGFGGVVTASNIADNDV
ncbi:hypothetical protein HDU86_005208, partial [Geranomyces michiganensis]